MANGEVNLNKRKWNVTGKGEKNESDLETQSDFISFCITTFGRANF